MESTDDENGARNKFQQLLRQFKKYEQNDFSPTHPSQENAIQQPRKLQTVKGIAGKGFKTQTDHLSVGFDGIPVQNKENIDIPTIDRPAATRPVFDIPPPQTCTSPSAKHRKPQECLAQEGALNRFPPERRGVGALRVESPEFDKATPPKHASPSVKGAYAHTTLTQDVKARHREIQTTDEWPAPPEFDMPHPATCASPSAKHIKPHECLAIQEPLNRLPERPGVDALRVEPPELDKPPPPKHASPTVKGAYAHATLTQEIPTTDEWPAPPEFDMPPPVTCKSPSAKHRKWYGGLAQEGALNKLPERLDVGAPPVELPEYKPPLPKHASPRVKGAYAHATLTQDVKAQHREIPTTDEWPAPPEFDMPPPVTCTSPSAKHRKWYEGLAQEGAINRLPETRGFGAPRVKPPEFDKPPLPKHVSPSGKGTTAHATLTRDVKERLRGIPTTDEWPAPPEFDMPHPTTCTSPGAKHRKPLEGLALRGPLNRLPERRGVGALRVEPSEFYKPHPPKHASPSVKGAYAHATLTQDVNARHREIPTTDEWPASPEFDMPSPVACTSPSAKHRKWYEGLAQEGAINRLYERRGVGAPRVEPPEFDKPPPPKHVSPSGKPPEFDVPPPPTLTAPSAKQRPLQSKHREQHPGERPLGRQKFDGPGANQLPNIIPIYKQPAAQPKFDMPSPPKHPSHNAKQKQPRTALAEEQPEKLRHREQQPGERPLGRQKTDGPEAKQVPNILPTFEQAAAQLKFDIPHPPKHPCHNTNQKQPRTAFVEEQPEKPRQREQHPGERPLGRQKIYGPEAKQVPNILPTDKQAAMQPKFDIPSPPKHPCHNANQKQPRTALVEEQPEKPRHREQHPGERPLGRQKFDGPEAKLLPNILPTDKQPAAQPKFDMPSPPKHPSHNAKQKQPLTALAEEQPQKRNAGSGPPPPLLHP